MDVRKVPSKSRKGGLIKVSSIREKELLCYWIVELPPFVLSRVTYKDSLLKMRTETTALVLLHMHIGKTAKNSSKRDVRTSSIEECEGYSLVRICRSGCPVVC